MNKKPNILWYCTDQQRSDTIGALGNKHIRTPTIDKLIERGVTFTRAYAQCPVCTPSRASFLTGRYPSSHHVNRNGNDYFPSSEVLVTKLLADAGYDCGLAGKLHLSRSQGRAELRPDDGYRVFHWSHHPYPTLPFDDSYNRWLREEKGVDPKELYRNVDRNYGPGVPAEYHQTTWCSEMTIRFITEKRDGPWLMSVNPFDPHPPFDPPKEYLERFNPEDLPYPLFREEDVTRQRTFRVLDQNTKDAVNLYTNHPEKRQPNPQGTDIVVGSEPPRNYDAREVICHYYAQLELLDDQFARIIDVLEETGQIDNTIIIFTSDHGELLGDHGLLYKGCRFFESLVHVPLVISWPARFQKALISEGLVELVDLAPTLMETAELEVPYYMQGKSLMSILEGKTDPVFHKPYVVSEFNDASMQADHSHGSMYFDGRYKICVYHGHEFGEIYDLENDPGEFENLWDSVDHKDLKQDLMKKSFDAMMATSTAGIERTGRY